MTKVARVVHNDGRRMLITTAAATLLTAVIVTGWTTVDSSMRAYAVLLGCIVAWACSRASVPGLPVAVIVSMLLG
ncbi:hypothetical protein [Parenemella sanctibonifatiensis]|uniref:Uncharacterized protein n=1 Tax=Parenemella sanctibonifatiensis TaxID=2016505 RepID=A0A255ED22_9ACTN|nr:hypothetical protein [Parenemella sanctibonifatiensis]OYN89436.1 hypothetical protein CGZ91_11120 [Parenemella sanctibonifatiensis]